MSTGLRLGVLCPLLAAFRHAEASGLDIESVFPTLVTGRSLAGAGDVASVLHQRVDRWTQKAGAQRRTTPNLIAGLIPKAQGVTDPDLAKALLEREQAMEARARALAEQAVEDRHPWTRGLGIPPSEPARREQWMRQVATVAAYRDRWCHTGASIIGTAEDLNSRRTNPPPQPVAGRDQAGPRRDPSQDRRAVRSRIGDDGPG